MISWEELKRNPYPLGKSSLSCCSTQFSLSCPHKTPAAQVLNHTCCNYIIYILYFKQVLCEVVVVLLQVTVPLDHGGPTWGVTLLAVASTAATMRARPSSPKSPMSWCPVWSWLPPSTQLASNLAQVSEIDKSLSSPTSKAFTKPSNPYFARCPVLLEERSLKILVVVVTGWSWAKGLEGIDLQFWMSTPNLCPFHGQRVTAALVPQSRLVLPHQHVKRFAPDVVLETILFNTCS